LKVEEVKGEIEDLNDFNKISVALKNLVA
jgi:hypothetical protein